MGEVLHISGHVRLSATEVVDEVWVVDGRLTFTRPAAEAQTIEGWALPGLVDAHCHIGIGEAGAIDEEHSEQQAVIERSAGTLLIRDAGSPADTRWIDDRDDLPQIIRAGQHLSRPRRYVRGIAEEIEPDLLAGRMAHRAETADGWVKLVGDWIDRQTGDLGPLWPREALEAGMAAAHAAGARVTAHCFAESSLRDLVEAGIDCIEHATGLTEELIPLFAERQVAIVPTLINVRQFPALAEPAVGKFPAYHNHMLRLWRDRYRTVGAAYEAGIPIYAGTDAGTMLDHGFIAQEVEELTKAGLPPERAIGAASWDARRWLGRHGLAEGQRADLVVFPANPMDDVAVLRFPRAVVLAGTVY